jgi:hypothetical protein
MRPGSGPRVRARPAGPRIGARIGAPRHPRVGAGIACLQPGISQRATPRPHPRIGVRTSALRGPRITTRIGAPRHPRVGAGITLPQPGIGQRTAPRPHPRIGVGTGRRPHPRIGIRASLWRHPRIGVRASLWRHPRIGVRASALRGPRITTGIGARRHPGVTAGITRLQPGIGRRTRPRAGEGAGSWVGGRTSASSRAQIGPPAMGGVAGIIGGRAPPGPGGLLRTSVSHASPLRPAERNPSWPSSAKSLHHAAGGAAT